MPEETIREIILSIVDNHSTDITPSNSARSRQSNLNGSTDSFVGCYVPIKRQKRLFKRKRSKVYDEFKRKLSLRNINRSVHGIHPKISQIPTTKCQPVRRSSLKIQADKMIQKVRKSFSVKSYEEINKRRSIVSFAPFPDYFSIDFISTCLLDLWFSLTFLPCSPDCSPEPKWPGTVRAPGTSRNSS